MKKNVAYSILFAFTLIAQDTITENLIVTASLPGRSTDGHIS